MNEEMRECCENKAVSRKPWYRTWFFWVFVITAGLLATSRFLPFLGTFYGAFIDYARMISGPAVFGLLLGGAIDYFVPHYYISKHLAGSRKRTICYSVGLGFLMSTCSHGILAIFVELYKKGASGPAAVSFLLASPWANLPITILLFGFFGWKALLIVFGALGIALNSGFMLQALQRRGHIETNPYGVPGEPDFSIRKDIVRRWREYRFTRESVGRDLQGIWRGTRGLTTMVVPWILIGMVLAGLTATFVPVHFFHHYLGPTLLGLLATLGAATVIEVCSEGTSPLAFEIYRQTGAFGNAFAFLMGGVVTDVTEIGLVWKNVGRRTALWMLAITLPQVLLLGWMFNKF